VVVQEKIAGALEGFPEAREAVVAALSEPGIPDA
jgi:hypothetical protein